MPRRVVAVQEQGSTDSPFVFLALAQLEAYLPVEQSEASNPEREAVVSFGSWQLSLQTQDED